MVGSRATIIWWNIRTAKSRSKRKAAGNCSIISKPKKYSRSPILVIFVYAHLKGRSTLGFRVFGRVE